MTDLFSQPAGFETYTLSAFAREIDKVIAGAFNDSYWIKAELARLNHYPESGHCYPDLVEREAGTLKAQLRGIIWARDFERIARLFREVAREEISDGIQVLFRASLRFHAIYGLSLQIHEIDPSYTLGQMAREKMETIRKLKEEGIFDRNRQLGLPILPKNIAVISVETSKGLADFRQIIEGNPEGFKVFYPVFPALLQGDAAVNSILSQLEVIRTHRRHFDAVAIIRGGGGEVGLSCYDHYKLARAVALFPLPVITGIGHSTNETVVEMVAFQNKITPTDVAYYILGFFRDFASRISQAVERLETGIDLMLTGRKQQLGELAHTLQVRVIEDIQLENRHIGSAGEVLAYIPLQMIQGEKFDLRNREKVLKMNIAHRFAVESSSLKLLENKTKLLDPLNILERGFSITFAGGKVLKDASEAGQGTEIRTRLYQGELRSIVESNEP